jgi:hypothetical protein
VKLYLVLIAALLLTACNRGGQSTEAVKQGVIKHLSGTAGLNVDSMSVDVTTVTFRDNEADAVVSIRPKNSTDPANSMTMKYTLERKGSDWVVKGRAGGGSGSPHGGAMPPAPPPAAGGGTAMPPGHPAMPSGTPEQKK